MTELLLPGIVSCAAAFLIVYACTPLLVRWLQGTGQTVPDVNKPKGTMVPRPGGPVIILALVTSELILYAFVPLAEILAVTAAGTIAFTAGFIDDRKARGWWFKPAALAVAAVPFLALGVYGPDLAFPLFGSIHMPVLYAGIVVFMMMISGNTINSIDVLNGVASGFMAIAGFSLTISLIILQNYEIALASIPIGVVSLAFYRYHKIPSRIFPGDSGALALGVMYGAVAIAGRVEVIAAIALLPAILNSFLFLSSIVNRAGRVRMQDRPVEHDERINLRASRAERAPFTLVRLILAGKTLSEKDTARAILKLAVFSGMLAVFTALAAMLASWFGTGGIP